MEKYTDYNLKSCISRFMERADARMIAAVLAVELGMLLLAAYKGLGMYYLPITLMIMIFSVAFCAVAALMNADRILLVIVLVLLNIGFLVQQVQIGAKIQLKSFLIKLLIAAVVAFVAAFLYQFVSEWLSRDAAVIGIMLIQIGLCMALLLAGRMVGSAGGQGATISLGGITPFELVKILYIFAAAGLLCKDGSEDLKIAGRQIKRDWVMIGYSAILSFFFLICSELGTLMIVCISGLMILWIYGKERKLILILILSFLGGFLLWWLVCSKLLMPYIASHPGAFPGILAKLVKRFGTAVHPERYMSDAGYQGALGLEAMSIGGWLGIGTERYRLPLPEASNDFVFANVIQTCGLLIGFVMILFFFAFLTRGINIAEKCRDRYYQGVAVSITILVAVEAVVHMGYNMALLPVTGIPLYFVSQGFTAIVTGMILVAVLLTISAMNNNQVVR